MSSKTEKVETEKVETTKVVAAASAIIEDPHERAGHRGFQSAEAMKQAVSRAHKVREEEGGEPVLGEVADFSTRPSQATNPKAVEEDLELVKVRSREYIAPFFYGKKQYSLPAGKDILIPRAVKRHLEEKNKL